MHVACVSYLNAKPLIDGLADDGIRVSLDVPSALIDRALSPDPPDLTLLPVADLLDHADRLELVPVGGIACAGPTWTVRLYSRVPLGEIHAVHADTDSHTSVRLTRVILRARLGRCPALVPFDAASGAAIPADADAVLLIGDKVVTRPPERGAFPIEIDLGAAWHELTGLPFVFAAWAGRRDTDRPPTPEREALIACLAARLDANLADLPRLVATHAAAHGWPAALAADYLGRVLRYRIGPAERRGIDRFAELAAALPPAGPEV